MVVVDAGGGRKQGGGEVSLEFDKKQNGYVLLGGRYRIVNM